MSRPRWIPTAEGGISVRPDRVRRLVVRPAPDGWSVWVAGWSIAVAAAPPSLAEVPRDGRVRAALPGLVVCVRVQPGDWVERDQALLVIEAMKVENVVRAPIGGHVAAVRVRAGVLVARNDLLCEIGE